MFNLRLKVWLESYVCLLFYSFDTFSTIKCECCVCCFKLDSWYPHQKPFAWTPLQTKFTPPRTPSEGIHTPQWFWTLSRTTGAATPQKPLRSCTRNVTQSLKRRPALKIFPTSKSDGVLSSLGSLLCLKQSLGRFYWWKKRSIWIPGLKVSH